MNGGQTIYFLKNESDNPIPAVNKETGIEEALPRFNANEGYRFKPGQTLALTEPEALHLLSTVRSLKLVAKRGGGEGGGIDVDKILGTAQALEHFGLSRDEEKELEEREAKGPRKRG